MPKRSLAFATAQASFARSDGQAISVCGGARYLV
jgi:hypothetical protein